MTLIPGRTRGDGRRLPFALAVVRLAVLGALAGCATAPTEPDSELAQAERRWQQTLGAADRYVMLQQRLCFCITRDTMRVSVAAGRITAVVNVRTGVPVPPEGFASYRTVAQLFEDRRTIPARGGRVLEVQYHPTQGFPTLLSTDPILGAADDEVTWVTVSVAPGA
jgi:hypothetical protein